MIEHHSATRCFKKHETTMYDQVPCVDCPSPPLPCCVQAHSAKSKQDLSAREQYAESRLEDVVVVTPNKPLIGRTFAR